MCHESRLRVSMKRWFMQPSMVNDYGQSWKSIAGDLLKGQVARMINEDWKNPEVLYLGTESGLFVTFDKGKQWMRVKANLPTVPIYEITLHPRDNAMILAMHRSGVLD